MTSLCKGETFPQFLETAISILKRERVIHEKFLDPKTHSKAYAEVIESIQTNYEVNQLLESESKKLKEKFKDQKFTEI